ncbi:hypothetical protein BHL53_14335 [Bacillus cereus]|uniref:VanW family protein n=1 Tax=Bacillus cereus TaxID=1396 RepID=UPI000994F3BB|nr:VanW family protein [Bacillus cereus]OPA24256.1 hypothetical protein BHL53_14335 [Bacillus cereus]
MKTENNNTKKQQLIQKVILFFVVFIICSIVVIYYFYVTSINRQLTQIVLPFTTLEGQSLEGKTRQEVQQIIDKKINELKDKKIVFSLPDKKQEFFFKDIGIVFKSEKVIDQIFASQKKSGQWERIQLKRAADKGERKASYALTPFIEQEKFVQFINEKLKNYVVTPLDAKIKLDETEGQFEVKESKNGKQVNKKALYVALLVALKNNNPVVSIPFEDVQPKLTTEKAENLDINHIMTTYKTSLANRNSNAVNNIQIAANKLNGTLLAPGDEFSYKKKVGKANIENGYKESTVFVNGKIEKGVGGGICQVASTLYNAALYSDLEILSRSNHSRKVDYIPIGLDATVDDNGPDLKFKNNYNHYIYIQSSIKNNELIIQIYGKQMKKEVILNSKIDKENNEFLYASSYRTVKENGGIIIDNQLIAKSKYLK